MIILFTPDCNYTKNILVAFALALATGRVGCLFAGCCSGKQCSHNNPLGIEYKRRFYNVVDKYTKNLVKYIQQFF